MNLVDSILASAFKFLGKRSYKMSIKRRQEMGRRLGRLFACLSKKRFNVAYENVKASYPEKDDAFWKKIAKESYENLGITIIEWSAFPFFSKDEIDDLVSYENVEVVQEALNEGNGLIFLSGHFGNWELCALSAGLRFGIPVSIIVKKQSNAKSNNVMNSAREVFGNKTVPMRNAARSLIKAIRSNEAVAMLVDQAVFGNQEALYPLFFDRPAATYATPAYLSLRMNTPIITGYAVRQNDGRYKVKIERLDTSGLKNDKEGIEKLTQKHVSQLECMIRRHPNHWSWMHKRWKRVPQEILEKYSIGDKSGK
jgi:KDO2-lipid IV(A) lauroyltransferase